MALRNDNCARGANWLVQRTVEQQLPWTWVCPPHSLPPTPAYSSLNGHHLLDSPSTQLVHLKHTMKILKCFFTWAGAKLLLPPNIYANFKNAIAKLDLYLLLSHLVSRQQDSLLRYLVSCSVFITLAYNFAISTNLISLFLQLHLKLLMKILDGTFGSLCKNALGTASWLRESHLPQLLEQLRI